MSDILKEKLKKDEEIKMVSYTCGNCDGYFILLKSFLKPQFCPFCGSKDIGKNDKLTLKGKPPDNRQVA